MLVQQCVEFSVARRFELILAALHAIVAVYRADNFPERLFVGDVWGPSEAGADGDDLGASEASVVMIEPVCLASAGVSFPTGSSGTPIITASSTA
jgi:hypothetical protein